jgi:hypothetical protein
LYIGWADTHQTPKPITKPFNYDPIGVIKSVAPLFGECMYILEVTLYIKNNFLFENTFKNF